MKIYRILILTSVLMIATACGKDGNGNNAKVTVKGYDENGQLVERPPGDDCLDMIPDFGIACMKAGFTLIRTSNCGWLCSGAVGGS